ncbi:hypothetical protein PN471_20060 [Aphanizomenon sp. CS-733/32]|uniref:hypothetical protein n=1 Tax=Aphanizomenon sp. CS-733/32 TaxID=3021715 RepID=UPI00232DA73F|nr:hypothetical protein [Aphanizomenon sp. CS-733/32]MDB9310877.1 hypothetical protein [Aphanizomenon sp. CS-733/32]
MLFNLSIHLKSNSDRPPHPQNSYRSLTSPKSDRSSHPQTAIALHHPKSDRTPSS